MTHNEFSTKKKCQLFRYLRLVPFDLSFWRDMTDFFLFTPQYFEHLARVVSYDVICAA